MLTNSPDLVQASYEGDLARVRALLSSGVDVNSQNEHGMGALLTFVPSLTEYLLSEGADPTIKNKNAKLPSDYTKDAKVIAMLAE
jgi:ankyrin repeat protein